MMGVVKSQINDLCDEIDEADKAFARSHHNDKYSKATYDAEETCKLLNAQKGILDKVLFAMEDIKSSMMPENILIPVIKTFLNVHKKVETVG